MIRKVTKNDYEQIARIMMAAFKNPPWNEDWSFNQALQRVEQLNDGKYTRCYVYVSDNQIIGVMCGKLITYVDSIDLMIEDFYLDPSCQGKGIGNLFMESLVKELKDVDNFTLLTKRSYYCVDFYQKNGFIEPEEVIFMKKQLIK